MYNYNNTDASAIMSVIGLLGGFIFILVIFCLAIIVFDIVVRWKVFKKAGKEGWEAIIPYYNSWVYFEISGYPGWLGLLGLASIVLSAVAS